MKEDVQHIYIDVDDDDDDGDSSGSHSRGDYDESRMSASRVDAAGNSEPLDADRDATASTDQAGGEAMSASASKTVEGEEPNGDEQEVEAAIGDEKEDDRPETPAKQ